MMSGALTFALACGDLLVAFMVRQHLSLSERGIQILFELDSVDGAMTLRSHKEGRD
jgi:hypothetical protein